MDFFSLFFVVTIKLACVFERLPCCWEGKSFLLLLTPLFLVDSSLGGQQKSFKAALMEASQLISSCHPGTFTSELTDGDKGSLKAILRQPNIDSVSADPIKCRFPGNQEQQIPCCHQFRMCSSST